MNKLFLSLCVLVATIVKAQVRLPAVISDNMVLQQNATIKLWGWGNPPEKVFITTSWNNKTDSVVTDGNGKWEIKIPTPAAGGPFAITIKGSNTITLKNILIGEVWVCSGQSNMEMSYYWGIPQMKEDVAKAKNSKIRFFHIPRTTAENPQENLSGNWVECDSNSVKSFSAAAYYFGKKLNQKLNVPVGLVLSSWGGTPAETWTPAELVEDDAVLNAAAEKINASGFWPTKPGLAYNAMIAPLTNFSIAGTIWYQGEANTGTASTYQQLFSTMISSWRKNWDFIFPFYFVQLAPYKYGNKNIAALIREAQMKTLNLPNTGMAVINDLPTDTLDIHPKSKKEVGERLAKMILADVYKQPKSAATPLFGGMTIRGRSIIISIKNTTELIASGKEIKEFEIADADKKFYPAQAKLLGNTIIVSAKNIIAPVAVRYAFSNTAQGNILGKDGMPLSPFRTDDWEVNTSAE